MPDVSFCGWKAKIPCFERFHPENRRKSPKSGEVFGDKNSHSERRSVFKTVILPWFGSKNSHLKTRVRTKLLGTVLINFANHGTALHCLCDIVSLRVLYWSINGKAYWFKPVIKPVWRRVTRGGQIFGCGACSGHAQSHPGSDPDHGECHARTLTLIQGLELEI